MATANTADFFGEGVNSTPAPAARDWKANPPRTNAELQQMLKEQAGAAYVAPGTDATPGDASTRAQSAFDAGNIGGASGAYNAGNDATRAAFDATHQSNQGGVDWSKVGNTALDLGTAAFNPTGYVIGKGVGAVTGSPLAGNIAGALTGNPLPLAKQAVGAVASGGAASAPASTAQRPNFGPGGASSDALGSNNPIVTNSLAQGNSLADQALGTQPTVDPSHQVTAANRDALTPVVDPSLAENSETDRALAMSQDLVDRVLNTPLQTKQLADQALSNQLLIARSARGGAGATQNAMDTALGQAPELLRQGSQQSINEQVTRAGAAGQAASIYAGVAGNSADRAVRIAQGNQQAGTAVLQNLTQLSGQDLQFDQAKMQVVGQLARDFFQNAQQFAQMDTQKQIAQWGNMVTTYGIDKNFDAAVRKIAADENIGPLDAFKLIIGGAAAAGAIAKGA